MHLGCAEIARSNLLNGSERALLVAHQESEVFPLAADSTAELTARLAGVAFDPERPAGDALPPRPRRWLGDLRHFTTDRPARTCR